MKILVLSFSDLSRDPRVSRQIDVLAVKHSVIAAGLAAPQTHPNVRFLVLPSPAKPRWLRLAFMGLMRVGLYETAYWHDPAIVAAMPMLAEAIEGVDLIVANDLYALPLALKAAAGRPVLFDAHEYSPEEFADKWWWRLSYRPFYTYLCGRYLSQAAGMMTVCQGIADEYRKNFGVSPAVVMNNPPYQSLEPSPVTGTTVRLVHHGAAIASRGLEQMIAMMAHLEPRFTLDFVLVPTQPAYLEHLRQLAGNEPRIRFLPPVPMREISRFVSTYDVGVYLLEPVSFNNLHALPNKFFEFVQGRLAIAIGPSPEMAALVRQYDLGVVAGDYTPAALAAVLNALTPEAINRFKQNSHAAAKALCYEQSARVLEDLVCRLTGGEA